jgi:hypothetical protein
MRNDEAVRVVIRKCHRSLAAMLVEEKCIPNIARVFKAMNTRLKPKWGKKEWKVAQSRIEEGMGMG